MTTETNIDLILAALGKDATLLLVDRHGGERRRIPKEPRPWLIDSIGTEAAAKLCQLYGDSNLAIPMAKNWKRQERDRAIRADFDARVTVYELVRKYELHESRIRAILNNVDAPINMAVPQFGGRAHRRDDATKDLFLTDQPS